MMMSDCSTIDSTDIGRKTEAGTVPFARRATAIVRAVRME
jgi:hypothetical protein